MKIYLATGGTGGWSILFLSTVKNYVLISYYYDKRGT